MLKPSAGYIGICNELVLLIV